MDHHQWFEQFRSSPEYQTFTQRPIAYFCAEFALTEDSPTYAGGLGILAGDMIREAADQELPLVAVGLYYHEGYLHHELYAEGTMLKYPMKRLPAEVGLEQVVTADNKPLMINIPMQGRKVYITAWEKKLGTVRVFLLDTDVKENDPTDRQITNRLYVANKETRFKQEMVLGIGGLRMLEALKIHPMIYHLNEGHSALLSMEVAHHEMNEYKKSFPEELERAKQHIVFTNHTLIAAGNDMFNQDMVSALLNDYSQEVKVPLQDLVSFGLVQESSIFSMTILALRMANKINAVSKLHAEKAKDIWTDHPMMAVTNGVHVGTWDKLGEFQISNGKFQMSNENSENNKKMWNKHQENKRGLLAEIKDKTGQSWDENHLLVGWARRMVGYKRPLALFQEKERLLTLLKAEKPVRIVMAGSAHESDEEGAKMLEDLQQMIIRDFNGYVVYLPNYNMKLSQLLTAGCDIWLNTPVVGFEACGTSGMKACLNGVLPVSTKDGWMAEVDFYEKGWVLESETISDSLLEKLEKHILPLYHHRDNDDIPTSWVANMHHSRDLILNSYSTTRMLREYIEKMYLQIISDLQVAQG